jgi:hypothetical protein
MFVQLFFHGFVALDVALNAAFFALEGNRDIYAWDSLAEEAKVTARLFARMASSGIIGGQEAIIYWVPKARREKETTANHSWA